MDSGAYSVNQDFLGAYPQVGASGVVDIRPLKVWVSRNLSVSPYLRSMILSDRDVLSVEEFLVKRARTLGRGLRRMYRDQNVAEYVSVVGTRAFLDFVESIKSEGVELEHKEMGEGTAPKSPRARNQYSIRVTDLPHDRCLRINCSLLYSTQYDPQNYTCLSDIPIDEYSKHSGYGVYRTQALSYAMDWW